jgi:pimeloyl-ACP methyl ester carboxylesterase
MSPAVRAVVIVSGGATTSPFTTPDAACRGGLPAGSADTFLREGLIAAGLDVFTSPAKAGPGTADADPEPPGFSRPPEVLTEEFTVNSLGGIDTAGVHLASFLCLLADRYGYTRFDLVGHSMGGLFSRAAIAALRASCSALQVRTLTTIGTPWTGSFVADAAAGQRDRGELAGDPRFAAVLDDFITEVAAIAPGGASQEVTSAFLTGADGWNARQAGVLDGIGVTAVGGDVFAGGGPAETWPNDGLVSLHSALAGGVPADVVANPVRHAVPDVHSIFFAERFRLPWERAITWDPAVLSIVRDAVTA